MIPQKESETGTMNKKTAALFAALMMLVCAADAAVFAEESKTAPFREGEKILFLGDSITHGGWYVAQLQYI